ncbi:AI-2E family transporter, partial [Xanthomonas citri pv. citri]|nr:AI-2E family transporter [Xanthomonas citri pv. citri]
LGLAAGGWSDFLWVVVSYSVLNFVLQSVIQPKVAGDAIGVIPTVSFLSLLFWAWVLGPLGAILALPCTLLAKAVLIDADPNARW